MGTEISGSTGIDKIQNDAVDIADLSATGTASASTFLRGDNTWTDALPTQSGNAGKFLTTDASTASWATVDALPAQSGNAGKFLTTDASTASWAEGGTENLSTTATGVDVTGTITDDSPFFFIRSTAIQGGVGDNVWTKVTLGTEDIDTAGACSSNRFTVPSGGAGIYYISANVFCNSQSYSNLFVASARIYKNGSATFIEAHSNNHDGRPETQSVFLGGYLNLAESDYIELYGAMNIWNNSTGSFNHPSFMSGGRVG